MADDKHMDEALRGGKARELMGRDVRAPIRDAER